MNSDNAIDAREHERLAQGLTELGWQPAEFTIGVSRVSTPESRGVLPAPHLARKMVTATRIGYDEVFKYETYIANAWAAEVLQAILAGRLGHK